MENQRADRDQAFKYLLQISSGDAMSDVGLTNTYTRNGDSNSDANISILKQIQKKKEENLELDLAFEKLRDRRNRIGVALKQQKTIADMNRKKVLKEM